jgi:hypothetical protein
VTDGASPDTGSDHFKCAVCEELCDLDSGEAAIASAKLGDEPIQRDELRHLTFEPTEVANSEIGAPLFIWRAPTTIRVQLHAQQPRRYVCRNLVRHIR